ncbi:hypothetical protein T4A_4737 [Trichinella pseudospiralis]|uniref:Uncharacterized protein n=2 Tax=Trichinella pseudospiralis TaxID=6337 RepID=A0A0V1EAZ5_TRIPS|nr:hypothetical protein T4A_4737 [Trichinella pseudospiralis]
MRVWCDHCTLPSNSRDELDALWRLNLLTNPCRHQLPFESEDSLQQNLCLLLSACLISSDFRRPAIIYYKWTFCKNVSRLLAFETSSIATLLDLLFSTLAHKSTVLILGQWRNKLLNIILQ